MSLFSLFSLALSDIERYVDNKTFIIIVTIILWVIVLQIHARVFPVPYIGEPLKRSRRIGHSESLESQKRPKCSENTISPEHLESPKRPKRSESPKSSKSPKRLERSKSPKRLERSKSPKRLERSKSPTIRQRLSYFDDTDSDTDSESKESLT